MDVVDYCITPFLGLSEETVRERHRAVMHQLERTSLKGLTGTFCVVKDDITGMPLTEQAIKLFHQTMDAANDIYLHARRELISIFGYTAAELDALEDKDVIKQWEHQLSHSRQLYDDRQNRIASSAAVKQQMLQFCTEINPYGSVDNEPVELPPLRLRDVEDHHREYVAWLVGTTANGHPVCRRFLSNSICGRDMSIYHVTPELVVEARWCYSGHINTYARYAVERVRDPAAYAWMLEA
jgi:hypothetical protein